MIVVPEGAMPAVPWGVVIAVSAGAAYFDVAAHRIPNLLTGPVLIAGLMWAAVFGGLAGLADAAAAAVVLALPYVLLFVFAGGGAGDAKLMAALGSWLGLVNGTVTLVAVALSGVVLAIGYALVKKAFPAVVAHIKEIVCVLMLLVHRHGRVGESRILLPRREDMLAMPYGVAVFAGVCVAAGAVLIWPV